MVFFKCGKFATRTYEHLCPYEIIHLKVGRYLLDLEEDTLIYLDDNSIDPIDLKNIGAIPFYMDLNIDFRIDKKIPLILNRKGEIIRRDRIIAFTNIETLFSSTKRKETKKNEGKRMV